MDKLKLQGKGFEISKSEVWEAYRQVKANKGAPGVDEVNLEEFDTDLKNNLYRIWNRMFFDTVPWDLVVKAVEAISPEPWVLLYVKRWLAAPIRQPDGTLIERDRGTPQGSAVSPVLANLFMHYAFDAWMARNYPGIRFPSSGTPMMPWCTVPPKPRQSPWWWPLATGWPRSG